jgi:tetratricopeptide (TPR) repeat protein
MVDNCALVFTNKQQIALKSMKNFDQTSNSKDAKHFLFYWREENVIAHDESGFPLDVLASNQLGRVSPGDTIWLVTINSDGELILAGRLQVEKITDYKEAVEITGDSQLWEARYYALPKPEKAEMLNYISLNATAFDLRFNSPTADRFDSSKQKINPQQMQTMRELTAESAEMLAQIWENPPLIDFDKTEIDEDDYVFPDEEDIRIFEGIVRQNPFDAEAYYNLGAVLGQAGETDRAIESYLYAVRLSPNYAEAWYNLGSEHLDSGDTHQALECFEKAIESKSDFAQAYFMAGAAHALLGDHRQAVRLTNQGLPYAPDDALAFFKLGEYFLRLNDAARAAESFERAGELAPDQAGAFFQAGECRKLLGENRQAIELYKQALQIRPDFFECYLALGAASFKEKCGTDDLFDSFSFENGFDLQDPRSFFYLGMAFLTLGELEEAREQVETLTEIKSPLAGTLKDFCCEYERERKTGNGK